MKKMVSSEIGSFDVLETKIKSKLTLRICQNSNAIWVECFKETDGKSEFVDWRTHMKVIPILWMKSLWPYLDQKDKEAYSELWFSVIKPGSKYKESNKHKNILYVDFKSKKMVI